MAKIDFKKMKKTKKKHVTQNTSMYTGIKIQSLFWLSLIKKNKQIALFVVELDNEKIANLLIEEKLVLNDTLHRCMRYNPTCKIKQYFEYYKYVHVLVYCRKNIRYGACSSFYRTLKCPQDKKQKCYLCNSTYISWDKKCNYKKIEYLRIKMIKQSTPQLYDISSKLSYQREEHLRAMRPPPKL